MNVLEVLGAVVLGYFIFVAVWLTKIEDYLAESEGEQTRKTKQNRGEAHGE